MNEFGVRQRAFQWPNPVLQPFMQGQVVRGASKQVHGCVAMHVDQAGHQQLIGQVKPGGLWVLLVQVLKGSNGQNTVLVHHKSMVFKHLA
jgi:hypothetical protein